MKTEKLLWLKKKLEKLCIKLENSILSDKTLKCKVVYGPVRSRRLSNILGINNIKQKVCPYDCVYCRSGQTVCCSIYTNNCLSPYELHLSVKKKLDEIKNSGKDIAYIAFVCSGDPVLDINLSKEILLLREFGYKIAVFTSSALIWKDDIQENLMFADFVSLKVDTVNEQTWLKINRPHRKLDYDLILQGIKKFSKKYHCEFTTETMIIKNVNDTKEEIESLSRYLNTLKCKTSYFMTPTYPPVESYAVGPDENQLKILSEIIKENIPNSLLLRCPETEEFFATDDFENELMGLLSLHPVEISAIKNFAHFDSLKLENLIKKGSIKEVCFNGKKFFTGNLVEG